MLNGQKVIVPSGLNPIWAGEGVVDNPKGKYDHTFSTILMKTGRAAGSRGSFLTSGLSLLEEPKAMSIVSLKRSNEKTGLKVYGKVLGESGKEYNVAYFRRPNFRGWICSCESFFFTMFAKKRNCKHLRFVRKEVGRFAASVK